MYTATMWHVHVTREKGRQQYVLFSFTGAGVALNNIKRGGGTPLPWELHNGLPSYCIQATRYFLLLVTTVSIKYYECAPASVSFSWSSGMQIASFPRDVLPSAAFPVVPAFHMISKTARFSEKVD